MGPTLQGKCIAEFIGTFALIFIGAGAICMAHGNPGYNIVAIALAHGLTIAVMVSATGHISGGHLNPAVTIAALVNKKIEPNEAVGYIGSQLLGGIVAAYLLQALLPGGPTDGVVATNLGTPWAEYVGQNQMAAMGIEAVLTFFLVFVIFSTGMDGRGPKFGPLAIGGTVALDILMGGPLTGASMNPARSLGPAVASNFWNDHWIYWVGPIIGGIGAGVLYDKVIYPPDDAPKNVAS